MTAVIYLLCALTAFSCACLLLRSYRKNRYRLLLWSGLCFAGMFLNNLLLVVDRLVFVDADLSTWRLLSALAALALLLYGLIWETE